jgi:hypothetical protein
LSECKILPKVIFQGVAMKLRKIAAVLAGVGVLTSGAAQASLVDRGGGLIYDTTLNVTWLQDANYAMTTGYSASGRLTWGQATTWAANLSYYDSVRNVTYTDWRLPTYTGGANPHYAYDGTDAGYNVNTTSSELAHLWYVDFQNKAYYDTSGNGPQAGWGLIDDLANTADESLFTNIQQGVYWTGTADTTTPVGAAWAFVAIHGYQFIDYQYNNDYFAWAVRPGDVAAATQAVPEPMTSALVGLGLAGMAVARRRRS